MTESSNRLGAGWAPAESSVTRWMLLFCIISLKWDFRRFDKDTAANRRKIKELRRIWTQRNKTNARLYPAVRTHQRWGCHLRHNRSKHSHVIKKLQRITARLLSRKQTKEIWGKYPAFNLQEQFNTNVYWKTESNLLLFTWTHRKPLSYCKTRLRQSM